MDLEYFPSSEAGRRMLNTVSNGFYDNSYVGKWIFQVIGLEMGEARRIIEELPYQAFPETATWGLKYHEQKYGLPVKKNLSYEERRKNIFQKRDTRTPMNPFTMEKIIRSICGCDVLIDDTGGVNQFTVFLFHAQIDNMDNYLREIQQKVNQIKQSHVAYNVGLRSIGNQVTIFSAICMCEVIRVRAGVERSSHVHITEMAELKLGIPTLEYITVKFESEG